MGKTAGRGGLLVAVDELAPLERDLRLPLASTVGALELSESSGCELPSDIAG